MHLSLHADYALRVLIYLGSHPGTVVSTGQISRAYGISRHHLVRVVQSLGEHGYVKLSPGRSGGVSLARHAAEIRLGDVFRQTEPHLRMAECFDTKTNTCPIIGACGLKSVLRQAAESFVAELNKHTLAELITPSRQNHLVRIFELSGAKRSVSL